MWPSCLPEAIGRRIPTTFAPGRRSPPGLAPRLRSRQGPIPAALRRRPKNFTPGAARTPRPSGPDSATNCASTDCVALAQRVLADGQRNGSATEVRARPRRRTRCSRVGLARREVQTKGEKDVNRGQENRHCARPGHGPELPARGRPSSMPASTARVTSATRFRACLPMVLQCSWTRGRQQALTVLGGRRGSAAPGATVSKNFTPPRRHGPGSGRAKFQAAVFYHPSSPGATIAKHREVKSRSRRGMSRRRHRPGLPGMPGPCGHCAAPIGVIGP